MELTTRLPKAMKSRRTGRAAIRVAAIRPDQSGAPCGDWDLKTPRPTVRTRTLSSWPDQQRPEVLVPLADEGQQRQGGQRGRGVREHDLEEDPHVLGAVEHGGLFHLAGHGEEELAQEEDGEGGHEQERQGQAGERC